MSPVALASVPTASAAGDLDGMMKPLGVRLNDFDDNRLCCRRFSALEIASLPLLLVLVVPAAEARLDEGGDLSERPSSGFELDNRIGVIARRPLRAEVLTERGRRTISL
jgi:hypothetical protein